MTQLNSAIPATPLLSIDDVSVVAGPGGAPCTFTVSLAPAAKAPVIVQYGTQEGTGSSGGGDYVGVPEATVTIPTGQSAATITIEAKARAAGSAEKNFTVHVATTAEGVKVAKSVGTATIHAPVAPVAAPPVIVVSGTTPNLNASDNLFARLTAARAGEELVGTPGAVLTLTGMPIMKTPGVRLNLNGAKLAMFPTPGSSSDIAVRADHFELFGGTLLRGVCAVRTWSDSTNLHDLTIADVDPAAGTGFCTILLVDFGGTNAKFDAIQCGLVSSVAVYWTDDGIAITRSKFKSSIGEDVLRSDVNATSGKVPRGAVIDGNTLSNLLNAFNKEVVAIRMGEATISNNIIETLIRAGQSTGTSPGSNATVIIRGNTFLTLNPADPQIAIKQGVAYTIDGNTFASGPNESSITIDLNSAGTVSGSIRKRPSPGAAVKPALISGAGLAGCKESGTTIV